MSKITITALRSSVCMGDDCTAPNKKEYIVNKNIKLSDFIRILFEYVPTVHNAAWVVYSDDVILGFIVIDGNGNKMSEINGDDIKLCKKLKSNEVFCCHYYNSDLKEIAEEYPECDTLLKKIKKKLLS